IEAVSGKSLEDYLREHVWGPLDMPDATFYPSDEQRERMPPLMFRTPDGQLIEAPLEDVEWEFASGGGGAHATARDYARFQRMLLARRRARRRAHPRARDRRAHVHRPPAGRAAARGHGVGGARAGQGRAGDALQAGLGPGPAPPAPGHPDHAPRRQRRLGRAVQLLLLDRPAERADSGADDAAAAVLRRPDRRDAARLRGGGLRAGGRGDEIGQAGLTPLVINGRRRGAP